MAELTIRPEEIRDALERFVEEYEPDSAAREEVGTVSDCGDGIAHVEGLPSVMTNELVEFEDGSRGIALNLDVREIGVVSLGDFSGVAEGQRVRRTGEVLSVPVGDGFLGRVVDPLGNPLDGKGKIGATELRQLEVQAPSVINRQPVKEPLQTGIKAIDSMTPIGRGQRELIIGDRQTGKTAIAIDTIINPHENWESGDPARQVRCVYVAIGQKGSTIAQARQALEDAGAMDYTTIVAAPASDPAGFKYIAPYTGPAIGQHWMYAGKHVLITFDDLSKQAEAYRAISLTDGQCFLESDLFNQGQRPAVNVGVSVSRVGGSAQIKAMRKVAGSLRLELAQYRELAAFAQFGSDLDKATQAQLNRGQRLTEILKQGQYQPLNVVRQVLIIFAGTQGFTDDLEVAEIRAFEQGLYQFMDSSRSSLVQRITNEKVLTDEIRAELGAALKEYKEKYRAEKALAK